MINSKNLKAIMKKTVAVILGITITFGSLMLPHGNGKKGFSTAMAYDFETDGAKYTYTLNYTEGIGYRAIIESVEFQGDTLEIPSACDSYPVYKIGDYFLKENTTIKTVIFPDTVTYIGKNVLQKSSVENIKMPKSLEHLGSNFASNCENIKTFECEVENIKYGEMGGYIFANSDVSQIVNDKGALCIGNWLVRYLPEDTVHVKLADLGNNGIKIEYVNSYIFRYLNYIRSIDFEGIKYVGESTLRYCDRLRSITNDEELVFDIDDIGIKETEWYKDSIKKGKAKLGKTLCYYKTDEKVLDLTSEEMGEVKTVMSKALIDCPNLDTIFCSSDCYFGNKCFYEVNRPHKEDNFRVDPMPETPQFKIKNVYLDNKKLTASILVEDPAANEWLRRNITVFDPSEFTKALIEDKTKMIFKQMDINYYGLNNDKIGTLTPTEEFYIRLKIFNYISMYDYDHSNEYHGFAGGFLLGGKFTCTSYAELTHYLLECAGVEAKTFFTDPEEPTIYGVHFWNDTKIGDEWFESDDGWSAQNNSHDYSWFLRSSKAIETDWAHHFQMSYDSFHFYTETKSTEHIIAERYYGDLDGNDNRDKDDAAILWAYIKGDSSAIDKNSADMNFDGKIDVTDAVLLDNIVNRKALNTDNVPTDGYAPGFWIAFLNGEDYDNIQYLYTDREGYITLPDDLFEAPAGKKISYDVGNAGQNVRLTTPLKVVKVKWIDENEPDYSESEISSESESTKPDSSKPNSSKPDSSNDSSKNEDKFKLGDVNGDRTIDIEDAVAIIQHINGLTPLKEEEEKRADVSKDGNIDIDDAVVLISYINGNSTF